MPLLTTLALLAFGAQASPQVVLQTVEVRMPDGRRAVRFPLGLDTLEFAISGFDVDISSPFVPEFGVTDGDGQLTGIVRSQRAGFIGVARPAHSNADTVTFGGSRVGSVLIAGDEPAWFVDEHEIGAEALITFTAAPAPLLSGRIVDPRGADATLSVVRLADRASGQIDAKDGSFACRIVPGRYEVYALAKPDAGPPHGLRRSESVVVEIAAQGVEIEVPFLDDKSIEGIARTRDGAVIASARLQLFRGKSELARTAWTDETGRFVFADVRPGTYTIAASGPVPTLGRSAPFEVARHAERVTVDPQFELGAWLDVAPSAAVNSGVRHPRVTDATGAVLPAPVNAPDGVVRHGPFAPGPLRVLVEPKRGGTRIPVEVTLRAGEATRVVAPKSGSSLSGRVVFQGHVPTHTRAVLRDERGAVSFAPVEPDGSFTLGTPRSGAARLHVETQGVALRAPIDVELAEGDRWFGELALPSGSITGRIVGTDAANSPLAYDVELRRAGDTLAFRTAEARAGDGWSFRFDDVGEGDYTLTWRPFNPEEVTLDATGSTSFEEFTRLTAAWPTSSAVPVPVRVVEGVAGAPILLRVGE